MIAFGEFRKSAAMPSANKVQSHRPRAIPIGMPIANPDGDRHRGLPGHRGSQLAAGESEHLEEGELPTAAPDGGINRVNADSDGWPAAAVVNAIATATWRGTPV